MLLFAGIMAAALRFWQLGDLPPGLYRDEAFNGLDALGVLRGEGALFFAANNGREPAYIYLTALAISLFGRTAFAVRFGAALVGTLTTWLVYRLAADWFGRVAGLLAAWLWAVTLWPVHLSRIGLRAVLLVPALTLALWLGTRAYRRPTRARWLLAGAVYGASAYTYVAVRFTPVFLVPLLVLAWWQGNAQQRERLRQGLPWAVLGTLLALAPLAGLALSQPDVVLGRPGQVSVLNPAINQGDLPGTLWRQLWAGLGMFFWRGDTILRHNPAGRPVFDVLMAVPFGLGLAWAARHWRRPAAGGLLLWTVVMLGPTILAEDAPHFLRAVGVLPAALIVAAVGLRNIVTWSRLPARWGPALAALLVAGSLAFTVRDYMRYAAAPDTAYLFESGARDLAEAMAAEPADTVVLLEQRLWDSWPSIAFLTSPEHAPLLVSAPEALPTPLPLPAAVYLWPHQLLSALAERVPPGALVTAESGSLGRGDLETEPYALFARYSFTRAPSLPTVARFGDGIELLQATVSAEPGGELVVELTWRADQPLTEPLTAFVHLVDPSGIAAQSDSAPASGLWPATWWRPGGLILDRHHLVSARSVDGTASNLVVGLYETASRDRLPAFAPDGQPAGDTWRLPWPEASSGRLISD